MYRKDTIKNTKNLWQTKGKIFVEQMLIAYKLEESSQKRIEPLSLKESVFVYNDIDIF